MFINIWLVIKNANKIHLFNKLCMYVGMHACVRASKNYNSCVLNNCGHDGWITMGTQAIDNRITASASFGMQEASLRLEAAAHLKCPHTLPAVVNARCYGSCYWALFDIWAFSGNFALFQIETALRPPLTSNAYVVRWPLIINVNANTWQQK